MFEKKSLLTLLITLPILLGAGCLSSETITNKDRGYANPDSLVDGGWLKTRLDNPDVKIIDLSSTREQYDESHIPGALFIDRSTAISDPDSPIRNIVVQEEQIENLLGRLGITRDDTIVIYDDGDNRYSARMYWILKYYGHRDIHILEGGRKLEADSFEMTSQTPALAAAEYAFGEWNPQYRVSIDYVLDNLDNPDIVLLDVRSPEEYEGTDTGADRGGHIPGAVNLEWSKTVNPDGRIKTSAELRELYEGVGVTPDKRIITYCSSGVRGAYSWFVMKELLGYPDVTLYDGSWEEWSSNPDVPIATGKQPG